MTRSARLTPLSARSGSRRARRGRAHTALSADGGRSSGSRLRRATGAHGQRAEVARTSLTAEGCARPQANRLERRYIHGGLWWGSALTPDRLLAVLPTDPHTLPRGGAMTKLTFAMITATVVSVSLLPAPE